MRSRLRDFARAIWEWIWRHPLFAGALVIAGAAVDAFFELAEELPKGSLGPFDRFVINSIQHVHSPSLFLFSVIMTDLLIFPSDSAEWRSVNVIYLLLPFFIYLLATRRYLLAGGIIVIPSLSALLISLLKALYHRPRPIGELIETPGYSFPSGHAFSSVVIYGLLGYVIWRCLTRWRWQRMLVVIVVILLVLGTGYARVYLGVHYPSDVVGGWIGGVTVLFGSIVLLEILQQRWQYLTGHSRPGASPSAPGEPR